MRQFTITAISLALGACAPQPESGSLAALQDEAQQQAIEYCLKTSMRKYPNVPTFDVWDTCHRAILKQPQLIQRVKH